MKLTKTLFLALALSLFSAQLAFAKMTVEGTIPAKPAEGAMDINAFMADVEAGKVVVIDVRTLGEYAMGHLPQATNIPIATTLEGELKNFSKEKPIVFMCAAGKRAASAYYLVADKRAEILPNVKFLDAAVVYSIDGDIIIKPNAAK